MVADPPTGHDGVRAPRPIENDVDPNSSPPMSSAPQAPPPNEPPPAGSGRPPLRRRREGRMLAGVATGLSDHLDVDLTIVRIVIVLVTILTEGLGIVAYVLAAIFIPAAEPGEARSGRRHAAPSGPDAGRDPLFWVGVGLLVLGALWLLGGPFSSPALLPGGRDLLWPLVLIAFGLALWRASDRSDAPLPPTAPMTQPDPTTQPAPTTPTNGPTMTAMTGTPPAAQPAGSTSVTAPIHREDPPTGGGVGGPPSLPPVGEPQAEPPSWTPPPEPPRGRSLLTRATVGLALLTAGVLWLLRETGVLFLSQGRIVAAALLVIGLGLLVGSVVGRGRWLILIGGLLVPVVIVAELLRPFGFVDLTVFRPQDGAGEIAATPAEPEDLETEYRLGAGSLVLDLSDLELDGPRQVSLQVGAGEVEVRLPADVTASVTAQVGVGEIALDGRSTTGFGLQRTQDIERGDGSPLLELDIRIGLGEATVTTVTSR
jgi:phage shock protein PspC (stress-responsive transcriptional regulator)